MSNDLIRQPNGEIVEADTYLRPELSNTYNVSGGTNVFNGSVAQQTIVNVATGTNARTVDASCCNIFVVKCKTFATSCFTMPKTKAHISGFDAARIRSFPSLFMKTNGGYCCCPNATQEFYWGFVTNVEDEGDLYRITYERRSGCIMLQAQLCDLAVRLKITPIGPADILDQTGWRIYPLDILKELANSGFDTRSF